LKTKVPTALQRSSNTLQELQSEVLFEDEQMADQLKAQKTLHRLFRAY
jgi:hypothetical protein